MAKKLKVKYKTKSGHRCFIAGKLRSPDDMFEVTGSEPGIKSLIKVGYLVIVE